MKRILFAVSLFWGLFLLMSCEKETPVEEKTYYDFIIEDYTTLVSNYPDAKDNFIEARFVLNKPVSEATSSELKAESLMTICYYWKDGESHIFTMTRDFTTGETQMDYYTADSPWLGDMHIPESEMATLSVSLEKAIENAKNDPEASGSDGLNSAYITLRKPLWPVWENPQFVFGGSAGRSKHVFVDSKTGAVTSLEMPAESGSTIGYLVDDYNTLLDLYWGNEILGFKLDLGHHMMQVQYTLNAPVNSVKAGELYPMDVTYVFFVPAYGDVTSDYVVRGMRDFIHGSVDDLTTEAEVVTKPWTGDKVIAPEYMDEVMSVEDAVYTLKLSNVTATDTPYVILHLPETPSFENPQYEFLGEKTGSVYVDAVTGEITQKQ
ncbi:MAG: hypothetical protein IJ205_02655 [Bacteroidales bacterium]|nr:hypothetical protein [Bacteroidales bacterium]